MARRSKEQRALPAGRRRSRGATHKSSASVFEWSLTDDDDSVDDDAACDVGADDETRGAHSARPPIPIVESALWLLQSGVDDLRVDADELKSMPPLKQNERAQLAHSMLLLAHHRSDASFFRRCVCDMGGVPKRARVERLRLAGVSGGDDAPQANAWANSAAARASEPTVCFPGDLIQHTLADAVNALAQASANVQSISRAAQHARCSAISAAHAAHASALSAEGFAALAATTFNVAAAVLSHVRVDVRAAARETEDDVDSGTLVQLLVELYGGGGLQVGIGAVRSTIGGAASKALAWQDLLQLANDFALPSLVFALVVCNRALFTRAVGGDAAFAHLVDTIPVCCPVPVPVRASAKRASAVSQCLNVLVADSLPCFHATQAACSRDPPACLAACRWRLEPWRVRSCLTERQRSAAS